jgi:hypothetical protein
VELGISDDGQGRGVSCFDFDRDGDLDIFVANNSQSPSFFVNVSAANQGNHLSVRLRGKSPNTQGVGARITVNVLGITQLRELRVGSNFASQDPAEAYFGVGTATVIDVLRIAWPDGQISKLLNVPSNQDLVITHPQLP